MMNKRSNGFIVLWFFFLLHKNVSNMLAQITGAVGNEGININNLTNQSKGDYAITIMDVEKEVSASALSHLASVDGIIKVRAL